MATPTEIVNEVLQGKWGNAETRKQKLKEAGYSYIEIQSLINIKYGAKPLFTTAQDLAQEVLEGRWGNGQDRKNRLTAAGQNYTAVQQAVNILVNSKTNPITPSTPSDPSTNISTIKVGNKITAHGIDISGWQTNVNFAQVKASGVDFIILREGYGTTVDNQFFTHVAGAKKAGIPIHGVYHFCYSINEAGALAEAQSCIANVKKAGLDKNTIIFFDFEYDTVNKARNRGVVLGKSQCIAFSRVFCDYVQQQGYHAGIYSNLDYYNTMYDTATINRYVYWIAHYNGGGAPRIPGAYHQYSESGRVNGINGNVDLDTCYVVLTPTTPNKPVESTPAPAEPTPTTPTTTFNFNNFYGKISNCGKDENGAYRGGQAGDQSGKEWWVINWYNQGWKCVLRHPNAKVREWLAQLAIEAAQNDLVGYDQAENQSYWVHLKASDYRPKNITIPCEADCSSGIIANTRAVGYLLDINALKNINASYTRNMRSGYAAAGFQVLTDAKYLNGYDYLLPGDIILNDDQHTVTNLGYGKYAQNTSSDIKQTPATPQISISKEVKFIGTVNANLLNVRTWAGTAYPNIDKYPQLPRGTKVKVCDTIQSITGEDWYYINYNGIYGFVSAQYIVK